MTLLRSSRPDQLAGAGGGWWCVACELHEQGAEYQALQGPCKVGPHTQMMLDQLSVKNLIGVKQTLKLFQ